MKMCVAIEKNDASCDVRGQRLQSVLVQRTHLRMFEEKRDRLAVIGGGNSSREINSGRSTISRFTSSLLDVYVATRVALNNNASDCC